MTGVMIGMNRPWNYRPPHLLGLLKRVITFEHFIILGTEDWDDWDAAPKQTASTHSSKSPSKSTNPLSVSH